MRLRKSVLLLLAAIIYHPVNSIGAGTVSYNLEPQMIAPGVYVFWGLQERLSRQNGANIVNTGFIVGKKSILVIDTGPTHLYATEMIAAINMVSSLPIQFAVVTHHHGDHAFGTQTFKKANTNVLMHPEAKHLFAQEGSSLYGFLELLVGIDWAGGTQIDMPTSLLKTQRIIELGQRPVIITPYENGHTTGDLVVYDVQTRTIFAGDLVFNDRAATIPHAHIPTWLEHLDSLENQDWNLLVPGHGPLMSKGQTLDSTRTYLKFLRTTVADAVSKGTTLAEIMATEIPAPFSELAVVNSEFLRSMTTLFRQMENEQFDLSAPNN
jgi:quinoprotein relay system zinc metallohydrolase 1